MAGEITLVSWSLVLYPISWLACILYLFLFFSLILMRLKLNLVNGLYALDFCTSAVFILIEVFILEATTHPTINPLLKCSVFSIIMSIAPTFTKLWHFSLLFIVTLSLSNSCCWWLVHLPRKYWKTNSGFPRISQWYLHKVSFSLFSIIKTFKRQQVLGIR